MRFFSIRIIKYIASYFFTVKIILLSISIIFTKNILLPEAKSFIWVFLKLFIIYILLCVLKLKVIILLFKMNPHFITSRHIYKRKVFTPQLSHVCCQPIKQISSHTSNLIFDSYWLTRATRKMLPFFIFCLIKSIKYFT